MWLKFALACWLSAAGADDATTYQFSAGYTGLVQIREANPTVAFLQPHPALMVGVLATQDVAMGWAVQRWVAPKHRRLAIVVLVAGTAFRSYLAWHNIENMRAADRLLAQPFIRAN